VVPDSFLQNHEMAGDLTQKINFIGGAGRESLPIWVIIRLKVALIRARERISHRNEKLRKKNAIHPDGRLKFQWEVLTTCLLIYTLFEIPYHVAFMAVSCDMDGIAFFNIVVDMLFCFDILLAFHTGYLIKVRGEDVLVDDHFLIIKRYLSGWFVVDLTSSVPLDFIMCRSRQSDTDADMGVLRVFKIARFLKLARLVKFGRILSKWQSMTTSPALNNSVRLFKLVVGLLMCTHIMGCGWFMVIDFQDCGRWTDMGYAGLEDDTRYGCECEYLKLKSSEETRGLCEPVNWLYKYDSELHDNSPPEDKYVASIYFTIIGLSTVGFGDITPANDTERVLATVYTLMGAVIFALVIGNISEMAQQENRTTEAMSQTLHSVTDFLEHRNVPEDLKQQIQRQMQYATARAPHIYSHAPFDRLPRHLRKPLMAHLVQQQLGSAVQTFPILMNMDHELRSHFLLLLRPVCLGEGEYLFHALDVGRDLYLLRSGALDKFEYVNQFGNMQKSSTSIQNPGDIIGVMGILDDGPPFRLHSICAADTSAELLELRQSDYAVLKSDYPDVYRSLSDMARVSLATDGVQTAMLAMRSRSMRRCAQLKTKTQELLDSRDAKSVSSTDEDLVVKRLPSSDSVFNRQRTNRQRTEIISTCLVRQPRATSAEKSLQDPLQQHANGRAASIPPAPIPAAEHVHPAMMGDEIAGPLEPDLLCVPSTEIQVFSPCKSLKSQSPDPGKRLSPDPGSMRGKNASGLSRSKNCSPEPAHRSNTPSIQSQRSSPHPSVHHPTVAEMQPLPPVKATKERGDSAFTAACSAATVSAAGGGPAGAAGHTLLLSSAVVARMDRLEASVLEMNLTLSQLVLEVRESARRCEQVNAQSVLSPQDEVLNFYGTYWIQP